MMCVLLGTLFKLMHWPYANEMVIQGLGSVIFIIPFYFIVRIKDTPSFFGKFSYFSLIFSSCVSVIGVLFKIMHWPGSDEMLILGISSLIFPSLLFYAIFQIKKSNNNFKESYYGFFGILLFCLLVVSFAFRPASDVVNTLDYFYKVFEVKNTTNFKLDDKLAKDVNFQNDIETAYNFIEGEKANLLKVCGAVNDNEGNVLYKKDDLDASTRIFIYQGKGLALFEMLKKINKQFIKVEEQERIGLIVLKDAGNGQKWTQKNFGNIPAAGALAKLTSIQTELLQYKAK
jgi:hypothetical protein